ncbi:uncharacterized protein LOC123499945 [Portunus trituberculatus]|uniref:uncharacterized protein LOC123499945 n=1 Tax=Portunus trituberculatus TaxID=210409 RepID=UPI001E1D166E|nr:uncharacterized protein LOC123499945 [Portunus trituberculatus]
MEADINMWDSISPGKRGQPDTPPDDSPERSRCCTAQDHPQAPDEEWPLADDITLEEVRDGFRVLEGNEVVELTWLPPHSLPRFATGNKVAIDQLVYYPRSILLPLLRCPGCLMLGHSINTCRSSVRCTRCSGPHPSWKGDKDEVCGKPFHCFQCQGSHGPQSFHCPHNLHAQQLYTRLGTGLLLSKTYPIEAATVAQEEDTMPTPHIPTPPDTHVTHHRRKPGRRSGVQPPPPTPIPAAETGLLPVTVEAKVHHPPRNARHPQTPHHHPRHAPGQYSSSPPPSRPSSPPKDSTIPTATASTSPSVSELLPSILWHGYHLYQKGSQDGSLEVVVAKVGLGGGWLTVAVCYNPGGAAGHREFMRYLSTLQPPVLIMGNFNAHHTCWEPDQPPHHHNISGNALFQALLDLPHVSLLSPPGLATRFHPHTAAASVLDLFLGDPTFKDSTFRTGPYMGSDHLPLLASLPQVSPQPQPGCMPRWRLNSSGWPRYVAALPSSLDTKHLPLDEAATTIAGVLSEAGTAAFPLIPRRRPRRLGKPWWDAACAQAVQNRRQAWNQLCRTPTIQAGRAYRRLDAICAKIILKAKRNAWDLQCSTLSFRSSPKRTMSFLRSMEALPSLAQPFKSHELSSALATLKPGKAPGLDKVPYDFICLLTPPLRACLLQLYNSSWQSGQFPSTWKPAILIPILKPGKDPTLPSAYRPVTLLSCIGKLLERLVNTRLTWWLEANNKLAEAQCGFHPHRSTLDVLGQIEYHICDTYRQRQVMTALFLDLEGAFDSTPHERILYKLALMGITGTTLAWVRNFLTGRSFQVAIGASLSPSQGIHRGVPQGSILSPLLFNVLLSDLQVPTHSHLLLYADDITIVSRAPTLSDAQDHLQEAATALGAWMTTWGLQVSASKSSLMCFTMRKASNSTYRHLKWGGFSILNLTHPPRTAAGWPSPLLERCLEDLYGGHEILPSCFSTSREWYSSTVHPQTDGLVPTILQDTGPACFPSPLFQQLDRSIYHHHLKIYTDGSRDASLPSSAAAIYDASTAICKTWRFPEYTDVLTTELFVLLQALIYLHTSHPKSMVSTFLHLLNTGWDITFQWVPSHSGIRGNEVVDAAAKMALTHPWVRKQSRILDVALTRLRLGHTRLTAHLHRLGLSTDPYCPWCRTVEETIEHFLLHCSRFHSHRVVLRDHLVALGVSTFDLPTLLTAAGVHSSHQAAVLRLTCVFLKKREQLPRL